jgi:ABC-type transport system substrate-binding protein
MRKFCKTVFVGSIILYAGFAFSAEPGSSAYYRRILYAKPAQLDPIFADSGHEIQVIRQLMDQLVTYDEDYRIKPMLAADWTISDNGRVYAFRIRDGVKFSDGKELTGEDVVFSIKRVIRAPASKFFRDFFVIRGAREYREGRAADLVGLKNFGNKVDIELVAPSPYFLSVLATPAGSIVQKGSVANSKEGAPPVGTGPFILKCMNEKVAILVANKNYFLGEPKLPGIAYYQYPDKEEMFRDFQNGKLDDIAPYNLPVGADRSKFKRVFANGIISFILALNPSMPPLDNKYVRQALAMLVNFDEILAKLNGDYPTLARSRSYIPKGRPGYDPSFMGLGFNPQKAKELIQLAGYKNFSEIPPIRMNYSGVVPYSKTIVEGMRYYYSKVGLRFEARSTADTEIKKRPANRHIDMIGLDTLYPDSYFLMRPFHSNSQSEWLQRNNKQLDELIDKCETEINPVRRMALFRSMNKLLVDEAHVIPLYSGDMFDGSFQPWVEGAQYPNTAFFDLLLYPVSINVAAAGQRFQKECSCEN